MIEGDALLQKIRRWIEIETPSHDRAALASLPVDMLFVPDEEIGSAAFWPLRALSALAAGKAPPQYQRAAF